MTTLEDDFQQFWNMAIEQLAASRDPAVKLDFLVASTGAAIKGLAAQVDALRVELREKGIEVAPKFEGKLAPG